MASAQDYDNKIRVYNDLRNQISSLLVPLELARRCLLRPLQSC